MSSRSIAALGILLIIGLTACADTVKEEEEMNSGKSEEPMTSSDLGEMVEEPRNADSKMRLQNERTIDSAAPDDLHAVVIRVTKENYVPDGVEPTVVVNPYLFTTRISTEQLSRLESDEYVLAIEVSSQLKE